MSFSVISFSCRAIDLLLVMHAGLEESEGNCPVCRKTFQAKDLEHVLDLVGSHPPKLVCPLCATALDTCSVAFLRD